MVTDAVGEPSPPTGAISPGNFAPVLAIACAAVGLTGLLGWHTGLSILTNWAGQAPMTYLTAWFDVLAGLALAALAMRQMVTGRILTLGLLIVWVLQAWAFIFHASEPSWPLAVTASEPMKTHPGWTASVQLGLYMLLPTLAMLSIAWPRWRHAFIASIFFGATHLGNALGDTLGFAPILDLMLYSDSAQPTVFSATALALALLGLSYSRLSERQRRMVLPAAQTYCAVLALTLVIAHGLEHFLADQARALEKSEAQWLARTFQETQKAQISAIGRMARRWESNQDFSKNEWEKDVSSYLNDMPGLVSLHWVNNDLQKFAGASSIPLSVPPEYNSDALMGPLLRQAQAARTPVYSSRIKTAEGRQGFHYIRPLYRQSEPDGYLVAQFEPLALLDKLKPPGQMILDGVALRYSGPTSPSSSDTAAHVSDLSLSQPLDIGDGHWQLDFVQRQSQFNYLFPVLVMGSGTLVALFVGVVLLQLRINTERTQALEHLNRLQHDSEQRLKEAQHIAQVGDWELDLSKNLLTWSDEIFGLFELDPRKFSPSYEAFLNAIHPDDRESVNQAYSRSLVDKAPYEIVHRLLMPDGRIKWVEERCSTEFDANGSPLISRGTVQDITVRHQIEARLKESEQNLLTMLKSSPVAARVACNKGDVVFFNPRYAELINLKSGDPKDVNPASFYPRQSDFQDILDTLARGESIYDRLIQLNVPGAGAKWTLASYIPIEFQGESASLGWFYDITELKQAQTQITEQSRLTQAILDHMVDGVITIDLTGIIQSFSPSAQEIFGYSPEEVIGHNVSMLMPSPHREKHDGYIRRYQMTRERRIIGIGREVEGLRKNGSIFPMELAVSEIQHKQQTIYIGIVRDITERKRVDKMKNEFVSTVSHELRTPLTAIRGALGLLNGSTLKEHLPDNARHLLQIAGNNTERLLLLINDILDIQKIESGQMAFHFTQFDLSLFLKKTLADLHSYADQHQVRFVLENELPNCWIYADRDRAGQVMANLLSNAAKFSPRGGSVEIRVDDHSKYWRISVTDHGPGIPEAFQPRLFERFAQADSSDVRAKGGTGLGLAITKAIVEKHGGRIGFTTAPGQGTTFFVDLPQQSVPRIDSTPAETSKQPVALIVEDDPDIAALMQRMLKDAGFTSDVAHNADETRQLLQQHPERYQLLTLDLILPGEDGISLLRSLRQEPETHELPVVVVSVKATEAQLEMNGGAVGVVDWLTKPIDQAKLIAAVQQAASHAAVVRVLHVEDDPDIQHVVSAMLEDHCEISFASTLEDARQKLHDEQFNLVLLDIGLPDGSGLDLLDLVEQHVHPPLVVVFSAQEVPAEYAHRVNATLQKARTSNDKLLQIVNEIVKRG